MPATPTAAMANLSLGAWWPCPPSTWRGTTSGARPAAMAARRDNGFLVESFLFIGAVSSSLFGWRRGRICAAPSSAACRHGGLSGGCKRRSRRIRQRAQRAQVDVSKRHGAMVALQHNRVRGSLRNLHGSDGWAKPFHVFVDQLAIVQDAEKLSRGGPFSRGIEPGRLKPILERLPWPRGTACAHHGHDPAIDSVDRAAVVVVHGAAPVRIQPGREAPAIPDLRLEIGRAHV